MIERLVGYADLFTGAPQVLRQEEVKNTLRNEKG